MGYATCFAHQPFPCVTNTSDNIVSTIVLHFVRQLLFLFLGRRDLIYYIRNLLGLYLLASSLFFLSTFFSLSQTKMDSKHKSSFLSTKLYQYELQTALYMLEPWEKALFSKFLLYIFLFMYSILIIFVDTIVLSIVSLSVVTMYQYTPVLFKLIA